VSSAAHHRGLEALFLASPTNDHYRPQLTVSDGREEVRVELRADMYHAAGAVHGSHVFKLLDDAAFFAASSMVDDCFIVTTTFTVQLLRPVTAGAVIARGAVLRAGRRMFWADARLYDGAERLVATGTGSFTRSRVEHASVASYASAGTTPDD
jgi:uncharacterized protein (TIGR00369 family)